MSAHAARVLLVADTHLGFDLPARPRVERRRRGPDFFACFEEALRPALAGEVDLVVHGGDLLYRSRVPATLVKRALAPLRRVADAGVPVVLVPGNHERSRIPHPFLALHPRIHLFDRPASVKLRIRGQSVAVGGFPFFRGDIRSAFRDRVQRTGLLERRADVALLCIHHAVEGATVGPAGFTFRSGRDVIAARDLPGSVAAVLSGHIHRRQVLTRDLGGRPMAAPVLYPGSVERTSFAERDEDKGYLIVEVQGGPDGGSIARVQHRPLPARPMRALELRVEELTGLEERVVDALAVLPPDAVVRLRLTGRCAQVAAGRLGAARLRALVPSTMNVSVATPRAVAWQRRAAPIA